MLVGAGRGRPVGGSAAPGPHDPGCAGVCALSAARTLALRAIQSAGDRGFARDSPEASRPWKLFMPVPRMLLARCKHQGRVGAAELLERAAAFQRGDWLRLPEKARLGNAGRGPRQPGNPAAEAERRRLVACAQVRRGEVSRARHTLTATPPAPGDDATWVLWTSAGRTGPLPPRRVRP